MRLGKGQPLPGPLPEHLPSTGRQGPGGEGAETASDIASAHQLRTLAAVHAELARLEEMMCGGRRPITGSAFGPATPPTPEHPGPVPAPVTSTCPRGCA
jgi:hypothetical protein